jgi:hypothetical protein
VLVLIIGWCVRVHYLGWRFQGNPSRKRILENNAVEKRFGHPRIDQKCWISWRKRQIGPQNRSSTINVLTDGKNGNSHACRLRNAFPSDLWIGHQQTLEENPSMFSKICLWMLVAATMLHCGKVFPPLSVACTGFHAMLAFRLLESLPNFFRF